MHTNPDHGPCPQGSARFLLRCHRRVLCCTPRSAIVSPPQLPGGAEVHAVSENDLSQCRLDGCYDALLLGDIGAYLDDPAGALARTCPVLDPHGAVYLALPAGADVPALLATAGLRSYFLWTVRRNGDVAAQTAQDRSEAPADEAAGVVVMAALETYDPVLHARALFKAGHPDWSLEVLSNIPESFLAEAESRALVAAERQLCILAWDRTEGTDGRLRRFFRAQREFYIATTLLPRHRPPYVVQAAFWQALGDPGMAARLLDSIDYALEEPAARARFVPQHPRPAPAAAPETAPLWIPPPAPPRILVITHEDSDYGMDTLHDGLCTVLGPENVVEFPWKPTLHGRSPERTYGYPCLFNLPGDPTTIEDLCARLREGFFDYVLAADTLRTLDRALIRPLIEAAAGLPLFLIDSWDEGGNYFPDILAHLGLDTATASFKREMLACADYGPRTFPLPFAYPDGRVPDDLPWDRPEPVFWAGKRMCGLRALYVDHLKQAFGMTFDATYSQPEYLDALHRSRIGLNFFGLGFDTVRYWELPAHGCMLLADRPPIHIPHDFRDGESAVFFDSLPDLEAKLRHYLDRPDETQAIARAGHEHFKRYHTGSARARQLLGRIQDVLRNTPDLPSPRRGGSA